ncbi:MAG: DEAD/DEAH box helicase [Candidatus Bathyarchaeota archaeon]|nr:DEAD/DEAH box helicase [Candidatus Bathyarchaeota archaeon]
MLVHESKPRSSELAIPNFPYAKPFVHQYKFFENRNSDILFKSPTSSGKTLSFVFSFINEYLKAKQNSKRIKCIYLVPTRLLIQSQFDNLIKYLHQFKVSSAILESGYTYAELFKRLFENDFIIASPDIIFHILLRKRRTQHIKFEYAEWLKSLYCIVFDELHLFDTYTLINIKNLIAIMKSQNPNLRAYLISATMDLGGVIDPSSFLTIDGESNTGPIQVSAIHVNYQSLNEIIALLKDNSYERDTIYVCNSIDRAMKLHSFFPESALLIGKAWYENYELTREEQIKANIEKCKNGALTFATSVFRQGVDLDVKHLIVEEPANSQDAIQTFGRCGRHGKSDFIMLTNKSQVLIALNCDNDVSRGDFERLLSNLFRAREYETQKRMMNAMWYKLYNVTRLKEQVEVVITKQMVEDFKEFQDFLPDVSFREPVPSIKYEDITFSLFEILQFKEAYKNVKPIDDPFYKGELVDGGRFIRREYRRAKKEDQPVFTLLSKRRYKDTNYFNLKLKLQDIVFWVNGRVGQLNDYLYKFTDKNSIVPWRGSFEPCIFFE